MLVRLIIDIHRLIDVHVDILVSLDIELNKKWTSISRYSWTKGLHLDIEMPTEHQGNISN